MNSGTKYSDVVDDAWSPRDQQTARTLPINPRLSTGSQQPTLCIDCEEHHHPRRLVICVDGTWIGADGSIVEAPGNTSNVHRLWQLLPVKKVVQDRNGGYWEQKRLDYVPGVGIPKNLPFKTSTFAAVTGQGQTGCEAKIKEVYRECCQLCPSRDEIFMFGFSRGAFIVRAVAGMLQHLGALRLDEIGFDTKFKDGLKVLHGLRKGGIMQQYSNESFRTQHTRESPAIRFLGVFDTVRAFNDSGLNDIGLLDNLYNVRHAMAIFERRELFKLERFSKAANRFRDSHNRSCQEAWFVGTHGNLGGACQEDGLALWPLQWILSEAQKFGLALEFTATRNSVIKNPADIIFPGLRIPSSTLPNMNDQMTHISYTNGISVSLCDLSTTFERSGFAPVVDSGSRMWMRYAERQIFDENDDLIDTVKYESDSSGVFIHPSVFLMDNRRPDIIRAINILPCVQALRRSEECDVREEDRQHWNVTNTIMQERRPEKPRILICGPSGVGKSSLINAVLGKELAVVNHGAEAGVHDIMYPIGGSDQPYLMHDSQGWQPGEGDNFQIIQNFLRERRQAHRLHEQVHCVWFCSAADDPRITPTDMEFLNLDFGQVPVVIVATKFDTLQHNAEQKVLTTNYREFKLKSVYQLPREISEIAQTLVAEEEKHRMDMIKRQWESAEDKPDSLELAFEFVSEYPPFADTSIPALKIASYNAMTGDRIHHIHTEAQKNWINNALNEAIDELVDVWEKSRGTIELVADETWIKKFIKIIIKKVNNVFKYEGFNSESHPDLAINLLRYSDEEKKIWSTLLSGLESMIPIGALYLLPGFGKVLGAGIGTALVMKKARATALSLIPELVHVLLIFERIYWYDGGLINDRFIHGACCYYLKSQGEIIKTIDEVMSWRMLLATGNILSKEKDVVRDILRTVVDKFRFKYSGQILLAEELAELPEMPCSFN